MGEAGEVDELVEAFWNDAKHRVHLGELSVYLGQSGLEALPPPTWSFGATPEQADELIELVLAGTKTATAGALWDWETEGEELPTVGTLGIVVDGRGRPRALVVTTDVRVVPFIEVDEEHARLEGEGDRSLDHWRTVHTQFFTQHALHDKGFSPDMPVVCERFEVLYTD